MNMSGAVPEAPQQTEMQYGALCFRRRGKKAYELLLITSRDTGRWVIPKGWPMKGLSGGACALREAFEEAGVDGTLGQSPLGAFTYDKVLPDRVQPCTVTVYPVEVRKLGKSFPEKEQRARRWFTPKKAASRVAEPELRALILGFSPTAG